MSPPKPALSTPSSQVVWNRNVSPIKIGRYVVRELAESISLNSMAKHLEMVGELVQPTRKVVKQIQREYSPEFGHEPVAFCIGSGIFWINQHDHTYEDLPRDEVIPAGTWVATFAPLTV